MDVKRFFFDRAVVRAAVDQARVRVLSKMGAFVRTRARSSIRPARRMRLADMDVAARKDLKRRRKIAQWRGRKLQRPPRTSSRPGEPPRSHTGILKRFLFFAYDPFAESVVIGPAATNQVFFDKHRRPVTGTVPSVLEYGGQITLLEWLVNGTWRRADLRSRRRLQQRKTRYRTVTIDARPYMGPALEAERPKLASMWADSVRAA